MTIKQATTQFTSVKNASISNESKDSANATQSLASNLGNVTVDGKLFQMASIRNASVSNYAANSATATQNISSNNGCTVCNK